MPQEDVKTSIKPTHSETEKEGRKTSVPYTNKEIKYRAHLIARITSAYEQREQPHLEFNDQPYSEHYDSNAKAAMSYNRPKQNKEDKRIVTGITQEKETTLLSAVLGFNLEPNIQAFDKDDTEMIQAGKMMESMVEKSRAIEKYDDKRPLYYKELFDQGTAYVEEILVEQIKVTKEFKNKDWKMGGVNTKSIKWDRKLKKLHSECSTQLLPGTSVYLGNFREFFLENQPDAFTYDLIPYEKAKYMYAEWDRFKYVPKDVVHFAPSTQENSDIVQLRDWTLYNIKVNQVEVIKFQDPINNEYMIMLNGVMMLPIEFPLTAISPSGKFTFAKGDIEPISKFFAISESVPSKTKVDQALLDQTLRMIMLEMEKSVFPPMANNTGKALSRKVMFPAKITRDINPELFKPIGNPPGSGMNNALTGFQFLKQMIDEKSVNQAFGGNESAGNQTATEILELKKQQMMKIGLTILGVIRLEKSLAELRIHNILANWTKAIDKKVDPLRNQLVDIYRTVSIEGDLENGKRGTKIFDFNPEVQEEARNRKMDEGLESVADAVKVEEDRLFEEFGKEIKKVYVDPLLLQSLELNWFVTINPTEKDSSNLDRVLFVQNIRDAMELFGPQAINQEYVKQRFALLANEDPEKFFQEAPPVEEQAPPEDGAVGGAIGAQIAKGAGGAPEPSLNTLMGQ